MITVNNLSAEEHALSKNGHILNFRVMAVREMPVIALFRDLGSSYGKIMARLLITTKI